MAKLPTATHQQKQVTIVNGKPRFYEPDTVRAARAKLSAHLGQHRPAAPLEGPLQAVIKWCYPTTREQLNGQYKTTRGDLDNMAKLMLDVMTRLRFWQDDAQVASLVLEKFWAVIPGIYVCVRQLQNA
ncbi:MAG: RusA family crossover junction endodeoxyribonuclease [Christensenellales bacterium]